jgi:hypothetical protein
MQERKTLVELAEEVMRIKNSKRDYVVPSKALLMREDVLVEFDNQNAYEPTVVFHEQLSDKLQIPKKYYDRMLATAPALLADNVNTWLRKSPDNRMVRTVGGKARALLSDRYRPLDNDIILETVLPILMEQSGYDIKSAEITDKRMYLQVISPRLTGDVVVGDTVQAGLTISNSEVGLGSVRIEPFLYRLKCLNGMIMATSMKRHHVGKTIEIGEDFFTVETINADNRAFLLKVRDTVNNAFDELAFQETLKKVSITVDNRIETTHIQAFVMDVTEKYDMSKPEGESLLANLINGGSLTQWGLANAVTQLANDVEDYDRCVEIQRIGGKIIDLTPKEWSAIQ